MFIDPGTTVYGGMLIGEHSRGNDLDVNVLKGKQLTNIRAAGKDEAVRLTPPRAHVARAGDRLYRGRRAGRSDAEVDPAAQALPQSRGPQARQETGRRGGRGIGNDPLEKPRCHFHRPPGDGRQGQAGPAREGAGQGPHQGSRIRRPPGSARRRRLCARGARGRPRRSPSSPSARRKRPNAMPARPSRSPSKPSAPAGSRASRRPSRRRAESRARRPLRRAQGAQEVDIETSGLQVPPVSEARWLISM